jgi:hypothetical protein
LNTSQNYCQYCGAALTPGKRFCEQCGAAIPTDSESPPAGWQGMPATPPTQSPASEPGFSPLPEPEPPAPPPPSPSYAPPPTRQAYPAAPPVQKRKSSPCLIIGLVLLVLIVCIGAFVAVGFIFLKISGPGSSSIATAVVGVIPTQDFIISTPALGDPANPSGESENQYQTEYSVYDDFSNASLGWKEGSDDVGAWGYESGGYFIQVTQPEYMVWKFPPVSFQPTTAEFDAAAPSGPQGGTFGVVCHFQDKDNFDFVEIDLAENTYSFGRYTSGEQSILSSPEWNTAAFLNADSQGANHVMVSCDPDLITLFINNEYENQVSLSEMAPPGDLAIFVSTWNDAGPNGFKIIFDNFSAWKPVQ